MKKIISGCNHVSQLTRETEEELKNMLQKMGYDNGDNSYLGNEHVAVIIEVVRDEE